MIFLYSMLFYSRKKKCPLRAHQKRQTLIIHNKSMTANEKRKSSLRNESPPKKKPLPAGGRIRSPGIYIVNYVYISVKLAVPLVTVNNGSWQPLMEEGPGSGILNPSR